MQQNRPRLSAVTINLNKQFFAMVFFLITFIGASYYAPEHLPQQPPHAQNTAHGKRGTSCKKFFYIFITPDPTDKSTN